MSAALTTPAATTGPEARERSGHDDGDTGARRRQRPRVLDRPGARAVVGLAAPAVLLMLWWAVTAAGLLSAVQLPSPGAVLSAGVNLLERGDLWLHVGISTQRVLLGFLLGAALGLAVGSALGLSRWADALFAPLIGALRAVPSLAWVPLLILWMQIGEESKVTLIAIGAFFPVFTTVYAALRHVDRTWWRPDGPSATTGCPCCGRCSCPPWCRPCSPACGWPWPRPGCSWWPRS